MWVDSHCHLNHPKIADLGTPDEIVEAAKSAGLRGMLTICCRISEEMDLLRSIAGRHENVWCSIGTHPHDAGKEQEKAITSEQIVAIANADHNIIAIGESGLDYYYNYSSPEDQEESFRKHIRACIAADLPLIVHSRDAEQDTMRIIREEGAGTKLKGVMHCFSSGPWLAEDALDFGFYISFSGIVTFKQSDPLREIARTVPLDRILVETDAPFLAPGKLRGKTNSPLYVNETGHFLAEFLDIEAERFAAITSQNFFRLFSKAACEQK